MSIVAFLVKLCVVFKKDFAKNLIFLCPNFLSISQIEGASVNGKLSGFTARQILVYCYVNFALKSKEPPQAFVPKVLVSWSSGMGQLQGVFVT